MIEIKYIGLSTYIISTVKPYLKSHGGVGSLQVVLADGQSTRGSRHDFDHVDLGGPTTLHRVQGVMICNVATADLLSPLQVSVTRGVAPWPVR